MQKYEFPEVMNHPIRDIIWAEKYLDKRPPGAGVTVAEKTLEDTFRRVAQGVYQNDDAAYQAEAAQAMIEGFWLPGGRVLAGAGTTKRVTLINCYVNQEIPDSMDGIMDSLKIAAMTGQMGGGIGQCFSSIRPRGSLVRQTNSVSSGCLPFMDMWNAMCVTVESSGSRRGAMMATLHVWHPDILEFIDAKHETGRLTNFNVSVLVTDAFMQAVREDKLWDLEFQVPRADGCHVAEGNGRYVHKRLPARELWDKITRSTYEHAEPGVIFIDRVNQTNPLYYCEDIAATNPCGEQPLPPFGACNLGHVNLAQMVQNPFSDASRVNFELLRRVVRIGQRFLDNVLDISLYPDPGMKAEAMAKRRTGLGITGLANMLHQLGYAYGSKDGATITEQVMKAVAVEAYSTSIDLAEERGAFPAYVAAQHMDSPFILRLPLPIQQGIKRHGIRNGVLLTVAPVGTGSLLAGNVSSGLEPVFSWVAKRKVRRESGETETLEVNDFGLRLFRHVHPEQGEDAPGLIPLYMDTAADLSVEDHIRIQAVCQRWVDSSISKTVNCPEDMTFEDFQDVYRQAWDAGLKGCTTYRPNPDSGRGSILEAVDVETTLDEIAGGYVGTCPECGVNLIRLEGCKSCPVCDFSACDIG